MHGSARFVLDGALIGWLGAPHRVARHVARRCDRAFAPMVCGADTTAQSMQSAHAMNLNRCSWSVASSCVLALAASACSVPVEDAGAEESVAKTDDALSPYDWSQDAMIPNEKSQMASSLYAYGFSFFLVHGGGCGGCSDLWFTIGGTGGFPKGDKFTGMYSWYPASMGGFMDWDASQYLSHVGGAVGDTQVYLSRYSWQKQNFEPDFQLPFKSNGSPALIAWNHTLYMIGVTPGTLQLWWATMNQYTEQWTQSQLIPGMYSSEPPALAIFQNRIYMVHHDGTGHDMVWNYFDGNSWTYDRPVPGQLSIMPPAIAEYNGKLHLVHDGGAGDGTIWWSYLDNNGWSTEVSLPNKYTQNYPYKMPMGLASQDSNGLVLVHRSPYLNPNVVHDFNIYWSVYH